MKSLVAALALCLLVLPGIAGAAKPGDKGFDRKQAIVTAAIAGQPTGLKLSRRERQLYSRVNADERRRLVSADPARRTGKEREATIVWRAKYAIGGIGALRDMKPTAADIELFTATRASYGFPLDQ